MLFAGYAPVHFICFRPIYERLRMMQGVEIYLSGGDRSKGEDGYSYDEKSMYGHFPDIPPATVLPVDQLRDMEFDVMFAAHTRLIMPKRVSSRIQIFHGLSFRNKAVRPENMACDHYFLVGPYMRRRFAEAGLLPEGDSRAVQIGFPKTDRLLSGALHRDQTLAGLGFSGSRPVILYAPTGARLNSMEIMGEQVAAELVGSDRYDVLVKLHDHPKNKDADWAGVLSRYEGPHFRVAQEPDVIPLLHAADLLITDASSVANEYTLLDRPLVFLDTPELLESARDAKSSMLDLDTWGRKAGTVVKDPRDLPRALDQALATRANHSELRKAMAKDFFYNPGTATATAVRWLEANVLGRQAGEPAA